jgi:DNA polymerase-1
MLKKFVLIDAHSIIYRSYFAFINNPLKNSKGVTTSGIYGFLNTLEKIKEKVGSDYMALAYDAPGKTFRDEVFEEYKATRPPPPEDIPFQVDTVKEICSLLGIPGFELEGYEADDLLATFATSLQKHGKVFIVTSDKDLMQLVSDTVFVYDAYKDLVYTKQEVTKKFGVPPERIGDFLALTGDTIDNIPGVPGIGPKRAKTILEKYPTFKAALEHEQRIAEHRDQALLSRKLVELECKVPLDVTPQDLSVGKPDIDKLMPILLDLELHAYIKTISRSQQTEVHAVEVKDTGALSTGDAVGLVYEHDTVYLSTDENTVYKIPADKIHTVFKSKKIVTAGYGLKEFVKQTGITADLFDVLIASWVIDPTRRSYKFEDIVLHTLNEYTRPTPANQAQLLYRLYPKLTEQLGSQIKVYQEIEEPLIPVLARMEQRGIMIDMDYLSTLNTEFTSEIADMEKEIHTLAGKRFNINSPKQLAGILFEDLGLKPIKRGKSHYSTSVDVLQQLGKRHPLPKNILKYREYTKIKSTYIEPLMAAAEKNRIHTTFNQTGTSTGRLSSSNPNVQNIPIRTDIGRRIRKGFIADRDYVLVSADYSQIELRILAHITEDRTLRTAFEENKDIHTHTASLVLKIPEKDVTPAHRRLAKVVNYGLIYGLSDYGLAQGLDIPLERATEFMQTYYTLYPEVAEWREQAIQEAEEKGYTETLLGRRRPMPELEASNRTVREFGKRVAINTPIQGTAADLVKLAMIAVEKSLIKSGFQRGLLLSIHDDLVFEIEKDRLDEAIGIIKPCMEHALDLVIPIEVSVGSGRHWDEAHSFS